MATYQILYWQEIPSFVEARDGDEVKKIQLSDRFQALIDEAAMRREIAGTDGYLEEWNKGKKVEQDGSAPGGDDPEPAAEDLQGLRLERVARFLG